MSKDKISDYSATANSNTDIAGINIDEGCAPSGINNAIRTLMKQLKDFQQGTNSDPFNGPVNGTVGATTPSTGAFTTLTTSSTINNITVGRGAGSVSTNTAVGASALAANTTGANNTAYGLEALNKTTTGGSNTALGVDALYQNVTGSSNTAVGFTALLNNTASNNTALGYEALKLNTSGTSNVAVGLDALYSNTTASYNTAVGYQAAYANTTGGDNVAIGYRALYTNTTNSRKVAVGFSALGSDNGTNPNTAVGWQSMTNVTTGSGVAVGYYTLVSLTTGVGNVAVGESANGTTTGNQNVAVGQLSLANSTTGSNNVSVGGYAMYQMGASATGNTALGYQALYYNAGAASVQYNTAIGYSALSGTTGNYNTVVGYGSGSSMTSGSKNTIIGGFNGNQGGLDIRTASNYIVLSDGDGNPRGVFDGSGSYKQASSAAAFSSWIQNSNGSAPQGLFIEYTALSPNNTSSQFLYCRDGGATLRAEIRSNGGLANFSANNVNLSDERTKTGIQNAGNYLAKICAIPVRTFKYKDQTDDLFNLGVIAQEVEAVAPELVDVSGFGETPEDGVPLKAIYQTDLQYALMKAIQELKAELDATKAELAALKGQA